MIGKKLSFNIRQRNNNLLIAGIFWYLRKKLIKKTTKISKSVIFVYYL